MCTTGPLLHSHTGLLWQLPRSRCLADTVSFCVGIAHPPHLLPLLGHARPLCFPITVTVSHTRTASLLVPFSILSCTRESVLVRSLQTLFVPSHYFTALQSAYL